MNIRVATEQSAVCDRHRMYILQAITPNIHSGLTLSSALVHVTNNSCPRSDTASELTNIVMAWCCGDFTSFWVKSFDSDVENATLISEDRSMSEFPVTNSTKLAI